VVTTPYLDLVTDDDDPIITPKMLPSFGINYHMSHLRRLWKKGAFPRPFLLTSRRLGWRRSVIRAWLDERASQGGANHG
jgi:predicted DNA-binding transcriptional regulator AlpA